MNKLKYTHIFVNNQNELNFNEQNLLDGLILLNELNDEVVKVCFFDPQYRGVLDHLSYGNEGKQRGKVRAELPQMNESTIIKFINEIDRILLPSGHLFLWVDKFHLCEGVKKWLEGTNLQLVDLIVWDKQRIGMGYRSRRKSEYCIVIQKMPLKAKGVWNLHNIPDIWSEKVKKNHPHSKPIELQQILIEAVTKEGDIVVDPAAGGYSVLKACKQCGRVFLGGDVNKSKNE